jgi:MoxR-like ATPase
MKRNRPNLDFLKSNTFCGVKRNMMPQTRSELIEAGFTPAKREVGYIEDASEGWMRSATMFQKVNHMIIAGPAGTGKDDLIQSYCHAFNRPYSKFTFKLGTNPVDWIMRTTLVADNGTSTKEVGGGLLRACEGVEIKRDFSLLNDGEIDLVETDLRKNGCRVVNKGGILTITIPSVVCFSDYDRATPDQFEILREALEMNKEKLSNPITGEMFDILPNTRFCFTANSGADGGTSGNITQRKDSSMLSRCIGIYAPPPTAKFERMVVTAAFPSFTEAQVALLVDCTRAVRSVCDSQDMGVEITLRQAKQWGHACLVVQEDLGITDFKKALKMSFEVVKGHLHQPHHRDSLEGAIDPFLRSDVVDAQSKTPDLCPIV